MRVAIGIRCPARFDVDERSDLECSDRADALHRKPVADTTRIVRVRFEIIGIDSDDRGEEGLGLQVGAETSQRFAQTTNESRGRITNRDESSRVVEAVQPRPFRFGTRECLRMWVHSQRAGTWIRGRARRDELLLVHRHPSRNARVAVRTRFTSVSFATLRSATNGSSSPN